MREIIRDLETDTDRFKGSLDHALDRSSINSGRAEDEINDYVRKFEERRIAGQRLLHKLALVNACLKNRKLDRSRRAAVQ